MINQSRCKKEAIAKPAIENNSFDLNAKIPISSHAKIIEESKTIENQLIFGKYLYRLETMNPKVIFGVAEPLIIDSGRPVKKPESQFWRITSSLTPYVCFVYLKIIHVLKLR